MDTRKRYVVLILVLVLLLCGLVFTSSGDIRHVRAKRLDSSQHQTSSPTVSSVDPVTAPNDVDTFVTITGTGFVEEEGGVTITAYLGTTELEAVMWVSDTELTATVPWGMDPGTYDLIVENPDGQTGTLGDAFTVTSNLSVLAIDPTSGPNDLDTAVTITGTGFIPDREGDTVIAPPLVTLGETQLKNVTWVSTTELEGTVPWGMDPGTYSLQVENPSGEPDSLSDAYNVKKAIGLWNPSNLFGGAVSEILINPDSPETVYAEVQEIGLFQSDDGGEHWTFKFSPGPEYIAIDPILPNNLYLYGLSKESYQFLHHSDDGGDTWYLLETSFPVDQTLETECKGKIKPYPMGGTLYVSSCGGENTGSGLIKSTDNGQTWETVMDGLTDTQVTDLVFHPDDPTILYLGTANGNIFISQNGGENWNFASQPVGYVHELDVNPFGDHELWVTAESFYGDPPGLVKSNNSTFTEWTSVAPPGDVGFIDNFIAFAPGTWDKAYSGTVFAASGYKSTDGGETWSEFGPNGVHHIYEFTPHPNDSQVIYSGVAGEGVYKTEDGGMSWQVVNQRLTGIVADQFQTIPDQPETVYVRNSTLNKIYKTSVGGTSWQELEIPDLFPRCLLVNPHDPNQILVGGGEGVQISHDGGQTWPTFVNIGPPPEYEGEDNAVYVLKAHPNHSGEFLAGLAHKVGGYYDRYGSVYHSVHDGITWTQAEVGQEIGNIVDIAYDPDNPSIVFASTGEESGPLIKSTDGGLNWDILNVDGGREIAVEPITHRVFNTGGCEGFSGSVCFSEDGGLSWEPSFYGGGVDDIVIVPGTPPLIYVGTNQGLYLSDDHGQSWTQAEGVLGSLRIYGIGSVVTEDRITVYVSTNGGYVNTSGLRADESGEALIDAGVYRWTSIIPTFSDVPADHWAYDWVEGLYEAGLTSGYPDDSYRPGNPVTRAEMAVFLLKGMNTGTYSPPAPDGSHPFSDIAGHWAESWMEELYDMGLTSGYPDGTYRPQNDVTRAEMAVFLLRAKHGAGYSPPVTSGGTFSDIAGHWAEDWIDQLAAEGITSGYVDGTYRPDNPVTRAEMAVFLTRTFDLPLP